jgi:aminobenzoyl-glutamate utilization protein B
MPRRVLSAALPEALSRALTPVRGVLCAVLLAAALSPLAAPVAAQQPSAEQLRTEVAAEVAGMQKLSQEIVDMVFSLAELGFEETRTVAYLTGILEREGFRVERGCAGMPTCYVASWGRGSPVIGIMGDIDGLPETSQTPGIPWEQPLIPGGPGHGEGHNSAPAVDLVAAIAVKRVMERHGLSGEIRVIPGVAEELVASRTYMVNAGMFRDMDVMLSTHISSTMGTTYGVSGSGLVSTMFTFTGRSAHSAGSPWAGRSALDAVELMNVGWNFRREHLRLQQRSHYVIVNGGSQPNVVPSEASVWYYFRELDYPRIRELHAIGQRIAQAAAQMTDTEVTERVLGAAWPSSFNRPLAEAMHANIQRVGMPQWTESDQALARAAQAMMGQAEPRGLPVEVQAELRESEQGMGGGSDDIAEVSWNVPTARLRYPGNIPGMTGHHWSSGIAMATPIAHQGANHGARVIAMTAIDVIADPALLAAAKQYFTEVTTKDYQWASLIPLDARPPIDINRERMARFRPLIEPLVYDPSRFATYLEQLGVAYPTVRRP